MKKNRLICTVTPNPVLDWSGIVEDLRPNEKSYVQDEAKFPGGNAINVARILTRFKTPVLATGFLGGSIGQEIQKLLATEQVKTKFVSIVGCSRIGLTISNRADHQQTRLSFAGPKIQTSEKQRLFKLLQATPNIGMLVIGGSLPPNFSVRDVIRLVRVAQQRGAKVVVDCPGPILREVIAARPFLIKPNLLEFQDLVGVKVKSIRAVYQVAKPLLDRVPYICISSVENGALLITRGGCYFGRIPAIKIKSTVGAGDSMVALMTAQLFDGNDAGDDVLRWGLAAAAATLSEPGTQLAKSNMIRRLYQQVKVKVV